jgi:CCR4-NOT transcription complex subunit 1
MAETIRRAMVTSVDTSSTRPAGFHTSGMMNVPAAFASIQPDRLGEEENITSPEEVSDKILFIINNLDPGNFEPKTAEMKTHFQDDYSRWLACYLVVQRVSTEPNNHQLYFRFLNPLDRPPIKQFILHETYIKTAAMVNSETILQSSSEHAVLKNLGAWLGQITLAQDIPIKLRNLAFKDFLIEGADASRLIVAIPFVCKILESCSKSKAFKPPNPWLMAVVSLLVELYHFAQLKLNLKFEIEVCAKALNWAWTRLNLPRSFATGLRQNR